MSNFGLTGSSTVGPFFAPCLLRPDAVRQVLAGPETAGEAIRIEGKVLDGDGQPVTDAMIEIWQANGQGRYNHPLDLGEGPLDATFTGFGRTGTDKDGHYWFETIKPGPVPFKGAQKQAPHLNLTIFSRGLLNHLPTRVYFEDEPANETDPVLQCVPTDRRSTLIARRAQSGGKTVYRFDIVMQGEGETAFFNI